MTEPETTGDSDQLMRAAADSSLSPAARGVIVFALASGADQLVWTDLVTQGCASEREARRLLQELTDAGYLTFERAHGMGGKFQSAAYHVRKNAEMVDDHVRKNDHMVKNAEMVEGSHVRKNDHVVKNAEVVNDHVRKNAEMVQATRAGAGAFESCLEDSDSVFQDKNKKQDKDSSPSSPEHVSGARNAGDGDDGQPNIFTLYHETFGELINTPKLAEEFKAIAAEYPPEWWPEAFTAAALASTKHPNYIRAVLDGRRAGGSPSSPSRPARASPRASPRPKPVSSLPPLGSSAPPPFVKAGES